MPTTTLVMIIGLVLVLGLALGAALMMRILTSRFDKRLKRVSAELHHRHLAVADQLRAAHTRAQGELEQTRTSAKRQAAAAAAEPMAALQRTEERLKAAYAELDRLRGEGMPAMPDLPADGFAMTQPLLRDKAKAPA